jgi:predicted nuclease with RNAse H fold
MVRRNSIIVVGIDLAGSPRRPTGMCTLRGSRAQTQVVFSDDEILRRVQDARPELVPIDAPLSLPPGRKTIQDRSGEHFRNCDRELRRRGIRFFPITLGPMRLLTERGMELRAKIETLGFPVVECYPGAAQDVWGFPRQHKDRKGLLAGLEGLGVRGLTDTMTGDELDAVTAALAGRWFLLGKGEKLGGQEGIIVPLGAHIMV